MAVGSLISLVISEHGYMQIEPSGRQAGVLGSTLRICGTAWPLLILSRRVF